MTYYLLKPCRGHSGFLSTLKKRRNVDLKSLVGELESHGHEVFDAKHLLVVKKDYEVTIYPNGKLLVKTDDKQEAIRAVETIYGIIFPDK